MTVKYNNQNHIIQFVSVAYNVSDISDIINLEIKQKFNIDTEPIKMVIDINRYVILIVILETEFSYLEVCIKSQNNTNIALKDFYQVSVYIS